MGVIYAEWREGREGEVFLYTRVERACSTTFKFNCQPETEKYIEKGGERKEKEKRRCWLEWRKENMETFF